VFTDLSGRFNYQQLTQPVSSASYLQESGLSLQIGQFQFRQVTPGAIVAGNYLDQWPWVLFGPRIYQVTPVAHAIGSGGGIPLDLLYYQNIDDEKTIKEILGIVMVALNEVL